MANRCNKTSNNKYFNCPPLMSDGRNFTDYRPNDYVNNLARHKNKVISSYNYRQFLIHNTKNLIKINNNYNVMMNGCSPCNANPIYVESMCLLNNSISNCAPYDCGGLGQRSIAAQSKLLQKVGEPKINSQGNYSTPDWIRKAIKNNSPGRVLYSR